MPIEFSGPHAKQLPSSNGTSLTIATLSAKRQTLGEILGQRRVAHLTRHFGDRIRVANPLHVTPLAIVSDEARIGIEIPRLSHASDVDDVALFRIERQFAAVLHVPV